MKHLLIISMVICAAWLSAGTSYATAQETVKPAAVLETANDFDILSVQPYDRPLGAEDAPVTIIEYASLSCPHCADFHNDIFPAIKERYIDTGKARILMRNFPTNEPALRGSQLSMCVDRDRYHTFLKVMYRMQQTWAMTVKFKDALQSIARVGGVSDDAFNACMENEAIEKQVLDIRREGSDNLDITGTPTLYINGEKLKGSGSVESISELIEKHLAKAESAKAN